MPAKIAFRNRIFSVIQLTGDSRSNFVLLKLITLSIIGFILLIETLRSFTWTLTSDSAYLHYIAYLITEHGFVPYRDILEINLPGTYLFHMAIGRFLGYSDLAFRLVDVFWFFLVLRFTWLVNRCLGHSVAIGGCLLFGTIYIGWGPYFGLQREFIGLLPFVISIYLSSLTHHRYYLNYPIHLGVGICFGFILLIKPHLLIGLPIIIVYSILNEKWPQSIKSLVYTLVRPTLLAIVGIAFVVVSIIIWLDRINAFSSFLEIFSSYVPLYNAIGGDFKIRPFPDSVVYSFWESVQFGGYSVLIFTATLGLMKLIKKSAVDYHQKLITALYCTLVLISFLYVIIGGKFWPYHWIPLIYFSSVATAFLLFSNEQKSKSHLVDRAGFILFTITLLLFRPPVGQGIGPGLHSPFTTIIYGQHTKMDNRVKEIADYLQDNSSSTDRIQPLCTVSGATHAMLITQRAISTPYIADYSFYHHVSTEFTRGIRRDFMKRMKEEPPRFIIDVKDKPVLEGDDVSYQFSELNSFLRMNYIEDFSGNQFKVYRIIEN